VRGIETRGRGAGWGGGPPPRNPRSAPLTRPFGPASPHRGEAKRGRAATAA
jgi:hypothetical protein